MWGIRVFNRFKRIHLKSKKLFEELRNSSDKIDNRNFIEKTQAVKDQIYSNIRAKTLKNQFEHNTIERAINNSEKRFEYVFIKNAITLPNKKFESNLIQRKIEPFNKKFEYTFINKEVELLNKRFKHTSTKKKTVKRKTNKRTYIYDFILLFIWYAAMIFVIMVICYIACSLTHGFYDCIEHFRR